MHLHPLSPDEVRTPQHFKSPKRKSSKCVVCFVLQHLFRPSHWIPACPGNTSTWVYLRKEVEHVVACLIWTFHARFLWFVCLFAGRSVIPWEWRQTVSWPLLFEAIQTENACDCFLFHCLVGLWNIICSNLFISEGKKKEGKIKPSCVSFAYSDWCTEG